MKVEKELAFCFGAAIGLLLGAGALAALNQFGNKEICRGKLIEAARRAAFNLAPVGSLEAGS